MTGAARGVSSWQQPNWQLGAHAHGALQAQAQCVFVTMWFAHVQRRPALWLVLAVLCYCRTQQPPQLSLASAPATSAQQQQQRQTQPLARPLTHQLAAVPLLPVALLPLRVTVVECL